MYFFIILNSVIIKVMHKIVPANLHLSVNGISVSWCSLSDFDRAR